MRYYIVDAFTSEPFGGNPAGVVLLDGDFPSDKLMQQIAAEFRFSETVFVQQQDYNEFTMRYFTPAGEVDLCGHATVAAFGLMNLKGMVNDYKPSINHTLAGDLEVNIGEQVMMQMATPRIIEQQVDAARLHQVMAQSADVQWPNMPIEIVSTGLPDIIMPVATVDDLNALQPDMDALSDLSRDLNVVGVHAFVLTDDGFTGHVRNFAPLYGIPEESATGTANAALTHYLLRRGLITPPATCRFMQGEAMQRPSVITTALSADGSIHVGGQCCVIARGELLL